MDRIRIIHIMPDSIIDPKNQFLGSTKDIRGRTEYFNSRSIFFNEIIVKKRKDKNLLKELKNLDLSQYTMAFFEYPIYPISLSFLRKKYPYIRLVVRSHNAEFYHWLHYSKVSVSLWHWKNALIYFFLAFVRLMLDFLCAKHADFILSITAWEKKNYWHYLVKSSEVENLPYFVPTSYLQILPTQAKKKQYCICLMSTLVNNLLLDAAKNFIKLIEKLKDECVDWNFYITGDISKYGIKLPRRIEATGFLEDPNKILAESEAIALLSDYGFGFKTKLLDAIYYKCYVLVTKKLYTRLPNEVQPYCIPVDINSIESFKQALEKCQLPYPDGNPNEIFRIQAFEVLDKLFCERQLMKIN